MIIAIYFNLRHKTAKKYFFFDFILISGFKVLRSPLDPSKNFVTFSHSHLICDVYSAHFLKQNYELKKIKVRKLRSSSEIKSDYFFFSVNDDEFV